jgi:3-dehydroquinate dehydratase-1
VRKSPLVCATIFAKTKAEFLKTAAKSAEVGCDIAELRVDHLKEKETSLITEIIRDSPLPLIVTNRSERDGGLFPASDESTRQYLIESVLAYSPAFIDIEFDLPDEKRSKLIGAAKKKKVGIICSHHDFNSTPSITRILRLAGHISETRCDITKLAFMPSNERDASKILEAASVLGGGRKMFTTFGMGVHGKMTRLSTLLLGSCLIYCSVGSDENRLGQIGAEHARRYLDSLGSYGWQRIRKNRKLLLSILQRELRSGRRLDYRFDPTEILQ